MTIDAKGLSVPVGRGSPPAHLKVALRAQPCIVLEAEHLGRTGRALITQDQLVGGHDGHQDQRRGSWCCLNAYESQEDCECELAGGEHMGKRFFAFSPACPLPGPELQLLHLPDPCPPSPCGPTPRRRQRQGTGRDLPSISKQIRARGMGRTGRDRGGGGQQLPPMPSALYVLSVTAPAPARQAQDGAVARGDAPSLRFHQAGTPGRG